MAGQSETVVAVKEEPPSASDAMEVEENEVDVLAVCKKPLKRTDVAAHRKRINLLLREHAVEYWSLLRLFLTYRLTKAELDFHVTVMFGQHIHLHNSLIQSLLSNVVSESAPLSPKVLPQDIGYLDLSPSYRNPKKRADSPPIGLTHSRTKIPPARSGLPPAMHGLRAGRGHRKDGMSSSSSISKVTSHGGNVTLTNKGLMSNLTEVSRHGGDNYHQNRVSGRSFAREVNPTSLAQHPVVSPKQHARARQHSRSTPLLERKTSLQETPEYLAIATRVMAIAQRQGLTSVSEDAVNVIFQALEEHLRRVIAQSAPVSHYAHSHTPMSMSMASSSVSSRVVAVRPSHVLTAAQTKSLLLGEDRPMFLERALLSNGLGVAVKHT